MECSDTGAFQRQDTAIFPERFLAGERVAGDVEGWWFLVIPPRRPAFMFAGGIGIVAVIRRDERLVLSISMSGMLLLGVLALIIALH